MGMYSVPVVVVALRCWWQQRQPRQRPAKVAATPLTDVTWARPLKCLFGVLFGLQRWSWSLTRCFSRVPVSIPVPKQPLVNFIKHHFQFLYIANLVKQAHIILH